MAKQWNQLERLDHKALKKLQAEREKAAKLEAAARERKKYMLYALAVLVFLVLFVVLLFTIRNKKLAREFQEERDSLLVSEVMEFGGTVDFQNNSDWESLNKNVKFSNSYTFRAGEESFVTVQMQLANQVKLYSESEAIINPPTFVSATNNKIKQEVVELRRGELTATVSLEGRDVMCIETAGIRVTGQSGLFKVIYKADDGKGEVVVKNGLVEVNKINSDSKAVKITGFYKVTFEDGEISSPSQASIIQYDWR